LRLDEQEVPAPISASSGNQAFLACRLDLSPKAQTTIRASACTKLSSNNRIDHFKCSSVTGEMCLVGNTEMMKRHRLGQVRVDTNESYRTATERPAAEPERRLCARGVRVRKEIKKKDKRLLTRPTSLEMSLARNWEPFLSF